MSTSNYIVLGIYIKAHSEKKVKEIDVFGCSKCMIEKSITCEDEKFCTICGKKFNFFKKSVCERKVDFSDFSFEKIEHCFSLPLTFEDLGFNEHDIDFDIFLLDDGCFYDNEEEFENIEENKYVLLSEGTYDCNFLRLDNKDFSVYMENKIKDFKSEYKDELEYIKKFYDEVHVCYGIVKYNY